MLVFLTMLAVRMMPPTTNEIRRSACMVAGRVQLCVVAGTDTLVLEEDSVDQQGVWINRRWWWPSCDGRVLTIGKGRPETITGKADGLLKPAALMDRYTDSLHARVARKEVEQKEMAYYLKTHGVQDVGYTRIAHYADLQAKETDSLKKAYAMIKSFKPRGKMKLIRRYQLRASWINSEGTLEQAACLPLTTDVHQKPMPIIVHTELNTKPWGAYAVRKHFWGGNGQGHIVTVTLVPHDTLAPQRALLTSGRCNPDGRHNVPSLFAKDGSPVFSKYGQFVGIISHNEVKR